MAISISQASDLRCPLVLLGNLVLGTAASEALGHIAFVTTVTDLLHKINSCYHDGSNYCANLLNCLRDLILRNGSLHLVLFYEYFHSETGRGLGASHQTGWTALVALYFDELANSR